MQVASPRGRAYVATPCARRPGSGAPAPIPPHGRGLRAAPAGQRSRRAPTPGRRIGRAARGRPSGLGALLGRRGLRHLLAAGRTAPAAAAPRHPVCLRASRMCLGCLHGCREPHRAVCSSTPVSVRPARTDKRHAPYVQHPGDSRHPAPPAPRSR